MDYRRNFLYGKKSGVEAVKIVDQLKKTPNEDQNYSATEKFLIAISTAAMMAKEKIVPKEYYQITREFLQQTKNSDGTSLPNISGLVEKINEFEIEHNIADEFLNSKIELPLHERIEIPLDKSANAHDHLAGSTSAQHFSPTLNSTSTKDRKIVVQQPVRFDLDNAKEKTINDQSIHEEVINEDHIATESNVEDSENEEIASSTPRQSLSTSSILNETPQSPDNANKSKKTKGKSSNNPDDEVQNLMELNTTDSSSKSKKSAKKKGQKSVEKINETSS